MVICGHDGGWEEEEEEKVEEEEGVPKASAPNPYRGPPSGKLQVP